MNYREIARRVQREGYEPVRAAKGGQRQFVRSVWLALARDARIVKVGSGMFDLEARTQRP